MVTIGALTCDSNCAEKHKNSWLWATATHIIRHKCKWKHVKMYYCNTLTNRVWDGSEPASEHWQLRYKLWGNDRGVTVIYKLPCEYLFCFSVFLEAWKGARKYSSDWIRTATRRKMWDNKGWGVRTEMLEVSLENEPHSPPSVSV